MLNRLGSSLAAKQAARAVLAACLIGLILSGLEVAWATWRERGKASDLVEQMLDLMEGSAAAAAWNVDEALAQQIGNSALSIGAIAGIDIRISEDQPLWSRHRSLPDREAGGGVIGRLVFGDLAHGTRLLYRPLPDGREKPPIGLLRIDLDMAKVSADYIAFVVTSLLGGLVRNILLGLLLTWVFHRFLTRPLVQLEQAVVGIDPDNPRDTRLIMPAGHEDDELGRLTLRINETLDKLDESQGQLRQLATRDPLTELPNRALLLERLEHALARARRTRRGVAVLFLDLDRFKHVNDSLGHDLGDKMLQGIARRLADTLRHSDTVGRLGGDEFLVVVEDVGEPKEAIQVADRVLASLARPLELDGHSLHPSASIGISLWPADGQDARQILRCADVAMYAAKAAGSGCWRMFSAEMSEQAMARLRTEARLRAAELRGEFELFYQPKVDPRSQALRGAEALLRWKTDDGYIAPGDFIPVAEETGLIGPIGEWVLVEACRQAAQWRKLYGDLPVAVNVSPRQLTDAEFPNRVRAALARAGLPASLLTLEITETVAMTQAAGDFAMLRVLRDIGVGMAIDDFGTGYSSLSHLRRIPLTVLKIDRAFMQTVPQDVAIPATILELGQRLGLEIVAEGVETEQQCDWLCSMHCQTIQGFLVSRPLPAHDFESRFLHPDMRVAAS